MVHQLQLVGASIAKQELARRGWRVVRLPAELVARDLAEAVARVHAAL